MPSWSSDGQWIYFVSDRSGDHQIWRIAVEGGEAEQVTRGGALYAEPSLDGRHLYFAKKASDPSIWRVPLGGGEEAEVVAGHIEQYREWAPSGDGIYYTTFQFRARRSEYAIQYLDLASGEVKELFRKEGPFLHFALAVSPHEEWVLYCERPQSTSELMLVENFR
jgi:Tol biopolymer transport system component